MALKRPEIDYSASTALRDLISLGAHYVDKDLDRKAKLKANAMIMAKGEYDASLRELNNLSDEFRKVQTSYGILFDKVPEIESTDSSKIVKNNLLQWYTDSAVQINNKIQGLRSQMGTMYGDIGDITRVKAGLSKSISPEMGDPKIYDEADFQAERVAKIFGVSKEKVESFYAKQPETVPTAISALNKLAMEAKVEGLKKKGVSDKEARKHAAAFGAAMTAYNAYGLGEKPQMGDLTNIVNGKPAGSKGYANGGLITEPIFGVGRSGQTYTFGERGQETVTPGKGGTNYILNVNVGNVTREADFEKLKPLIQRWILEANSRRGVV